MPWYYLWRDPRPSARTASMGLLRTEPVEVGPFDTQAEARMALEADRKASQLPPLRVKQRRHNNVPCKQTIFAGPYLRRKALTPLEKLARDPDALIQPDLQL